MSIQTGDHDVDQVLAGMQQGLAELHRLWQQARKMLDSWRQGRTSVEDLLNRRNWDQGLDRALPQQQDQSQQAELAALQAYERDLATRIQEQQARIDELQRQRDQNLNNDRDRDGKDDREQARTDGDGDGIDDDVEDAERTAEEIEDDHDRDGDGKDDAVQHRQEEQAAADADRQKREDQERQARENGEPGVDADDAVEAAAGAAVVAEAVDEELDHQNEAGDADALRADNEQQTLTDNEHDLQAGADTEQGVDANATNDAARDQAVEPEQATDAEVGNAAGVDQQAGAEEQNAAADPSQAADNQLQADSPEQGATAERGDNVVAVGQGGVENGQQNVVEWDTERDGTHIDASNDGPNTVYRIPEGQSVSLEVRGGADPDSPGMDMKDIGRDAADSNDRSINIGDISGDNQTFVVDQDGVHQGVQEGDRVVAAARQQGQQVQDGLQAEDGQQQPQQTLEQPAFPTAGDAAAANRVEEQSTEATRQSGQNAQQAAQVENRDKQENKALDPLRAENAKNKDKNPPGRSQAEMSPEEIDHQQQKVNAGLPSAAGAPGYDAGEPANAGASGGRAYADRARDQGTRGPDRGNDGRGRGE